MKSNRVMTVSSLAEKLDSIPQKETLLRIADTERPLAKYFFSINNHHELYQMGNSYLKDFNQGAKSFAITSTGYKTSQQRTILALASFFDHVKPMRIAIVSHQLLDGAFHSMVEASADHQLKLSPLTTKSLSVKKFYHHFDFVEFQSLLSLSPNGMANFEFEQAIEDFVKSYDVIFWDIPDIEVFKTNHQIYYPISLHFHSVSIIVAQSLSKTREVEELQRFFTDYGVNIKGLLLDYASKKDVKKRSLNPLNLLRRII